MSATCHDCAQAAITSHWIFAAGCRGCCARSIARSPDFHAARAAGGRAGSPEVRKYMALLDQVGGLVKPPITHEEVRLANANDAASRDRAQPSPQPATTEGVLP